MNKKILVIISSMVPSEKSYSIELANRFIKYYKKYNKNDEIEVLDLNKIDIAEKNITSNNFSNFLNTNDTDKYINQLKSIDKLVFTTPMINFNITSVAKNYLDHILVANKTFSYKYSKKGDAIGLLTNLKVQILTTQGAPFGWYKWGNLGKYLKGVWKFAGAEVMNPFLISGTKIEKNKKLSPKELVNNYDHKIEIIAKKF